MREPLLLKGPALARALYRPGEHRGYSDVDLLVAPRDLARARQTLAERGYVNATEGLGVDDVAGVLHSETWARAVEAGLEHVLVDLHWRLFGCQASAESAWEALTARRAWVELDGRRVAVLAPEGLALHVATHAAQHGPGDAKAMADLARGVERWAASVWREAARLAADLGATASLAAGLRLNPRGAELARELGLPRTDQLDWAILHREARPRGAFHLQAMARARGPRQRLEVLRRSLLPTRRWIAYQYPWAAASRVRLVAAYGAHLLRAPVWAARAWRYRRRERRAD